MGYAYDHLESKTVGDLERMFLYMAFRIRDAKDLEIYNKVVNELDKRGAL